MSLIADIVRPQAAKTRDRFPGLPVVIITLRPSCCAVSGLWTSAWSCYPSSAFTDDAAPGSADAAAVPGYP